MHLTDLAIKNLPIPEKGQKDYRDDVLKGFTVRVSQGGSRVFYLVHGRARRRTKIGAYPIISLAQARQKAKEILAERTLGKDKPKTIVFSDALVEFLDSYTGRKPRTISDTTSILKRHFLPPLRHERIAEITPDQIARIITRLQNRPTTARHALANIKMFFSWCEAQGYVLISPCVKLQAPPKPASRDRVLTDDELSKVLKTAQDTPFPFGPIVLLLILTGQRRSEIGSLQWDHIAGDTITLPPELTKNKHTHTFPIGTWAQEVIATVPHRNTNPYLFPSWSKRATGKYTDLDPLLK
jgi:integrase